MKYLKFLFFYLIIFALSPINQKVLWAHPFSMPVTKTAPLQVIRLGKDTASISEGAFLITSAKPFDVLRPEDLMDLTLVLKYKAKDCEYQWPDISVDYIQFKEKKFVYSSFVPEDKPHQDIKYYPNKNDYAGFNKKDLLFSRFSDENKVVRASDSYTIWRPPALSDLAKGSLIMINQAYRYMIPDDFSLFPYNSKSSEFFEHALLRPSIYKVFVTFLTSKKADRVPSEKSVVCFYFEVGGSLVSSADMILIDDLQRDFAKNKRSYFMGKEDLEPTYYPLQNGETIMRIKNA